MRKGDSSVRKTAISRAGNMSNSHNRWSLRPALPKYWEAIREIRNDQRIGFKQTSLIDPETHKTFMQKHCQNYRVATEKNEEDGEERVIGFVGVVGDDGRIATHKDYTGRGVATFMWSGLSKEYPQITHRCLRDNHLALALNKKFGYVPDPNDVESGSQVVRLIKCPKLLAHGNRESRCKL